MIRTLYSATGERVRDCGGHEATMQLAEKWGAVVIGWDGDAVFYEIDGFRGVISGCFGRRVAAGRQSEVGYEIAKRKLEGYLEIRHWLREDAL